MKYKGSGINDSLTSRYLGSRKVLIGRCHHVTTMSSKKMLHTCMMSGLAQSIPRVKGAIHGSTTRLYSEVLLYQKVQAGKDQEKAQSEKDSHSKNRGGKKPN